MRVFQGRISGVRGVSMKDNRGERGFQGRMSGMRGFQGANQEDIPEMLPLATAAENSSDIQMWN